MLNATLLTIKNLGNRHISSYHIEKFPKFLIALENEQLHDVQLLIEDKENPNNYNIVREQNEITLQFDFMQIKDSVQIRIVHAPDNNPRIQSEAIIMAGKIKRLGQLIFKYKEFVALVLILVLSSASIASMAIISQPTQDRRAVQANAIQVANWTTLPPATTSPLATTTASPLSTTLPPVPVNATISRPATTMTSQPTTTSFLTTATTSQLTTTSPPATITSSLSSQFIDLLQTIFWFIFGLWR